MEPIPLVCSIELSDVCNARCNYCTIGINDGRPPHYSQRMGFLNIGDFRRTFDQLPAYLHDPVSAPYTDLRVAVRLCGIGEPTLHRDFLEFFSIALNQPAVQQLTVVTNGSYLPPARTEAMARLIRARPELPVDFLLGLDAIDPAVQFRVKGIANSTEIAANLEHFLDLKVRDALNNLRFIFQMVVTDENCGHAKSFYRFWEDVLRSKALSVALTPDCGYLGRLEDFDAFIWIKRREAAAPTEDQSHFDHLHRSALAELGFDTPATLIHDPPKMDPACPEQKSSAPTDHARICGLFWYGMNINAAGEVSPCCIDEHFELKIGDLKQASLQDIYRGETMLRLREAHLDRDFSQLPLCAHCDSFHKYKLIPREEIDKFLDGIAALKTEAGLAPAAEAETES